MPADAALENAVTFTPCEAETSLTDADVAAIVRGMAGGGAGWARPAGEVTR